MDRSFWFAVAALVLVPAGAAAQEQPAPRDQSPILQINAHGPSRYVSALAFSPDGRTLYSGGWDKVVHVWQLDGDTGKFTYHPDLVFRVPIGPGTSGGINAISVSADGRWLAAAGTGPARGLAGFQDQSALVLPSAALTDAQRQELGTIYVFDTSNRTTHVLRGHNAPVVAMEFVPGKTNPTLVSAAQEAVSNGSAGAVHVWDVVNQTSIAKLSKVPDPRGGGRNWAPIPDPAGWRPSIAPWRTGPGAGQLRVAIAWGDNDPADRNRGLFRVWEVDTGKVSTSDTGAFPLVVESHGSAAGNQLLFSGAHRELGVWRVPNGPLQVLNRLRNFRALAGVGLRNLPRSAALFAARPGGPPNRAVVAIQNQAEDDRTAGMELQLVDLDQPGLIGRRIPLWDGPVNELKDPYIAATGQGGGFLAVAGNSDHSIRVYRTANLLAGNAGQPQLLRGTGLSWQRVAFVKKGDALGLQLQANAGGGGRSLIFDVTNGAVDAAAGWQPSAPAPGEWRAQHDQAGRRIRVMRNNQPFGAPIAVPDNWEVTSLAVVPPGEQVQVPLVAVASHRRGEPQLSLFNGQTGGELRHYAGHGERIRGLAVAADGRLLASVADDRTVRVWWVADITETLGKLGRISGLLVEERDGSLAVARVDADAPAAGNLRAGDVVLSARTADGPVTFKTRWDFYQFVAGTAPGSPVTLDIRGRENPVAIAAEQGVDQKNPLFSLFLDPAIQGDAVSWIGWNPIGPYEHSDRDAERYLGWHINTGDPRSPTSFASADQHRNNYREGLLKMLIEEGPAGIPKPDKDEVGGADLKLNLSIVSVDGEPLNVVYDPPVLLDAPNLEVSVTVENAPLSGLRGVQWQLNRGDAQGEVQTIARAGTDGVFRAPLGDVPRGDYTLTATPLAKDPERTFPPEELQIRYLRRPPIIEADPKTLPKETNEPAVPFKAAVRNDEFAGPFDVELIHNGNLIKKWTTEGGQSLEIEDELALVSGENSILLKARNSNALKARDAAGHESASQGWTIFHREPGPPIIAVAQLLDGESGRELQPVLVDPPPGQLVPRKLVVTASPSIRLKGRVTAPDTIADILVVHGAAAAGQALQNFVAGKSKQFDFDETLPLQPGRQTIALRAATTLKKQAEELIDVDYVPPLPFNPQVTLETGPAGRPVVLVPDREHQLFRGKDPQTVALKVRFQPPSYPQPAQAQLEVNGAAVGAPLAIGAQAGEHVQEIDLANGPNVIRYLVSNEWRSDPRPLGSYTVNYRRPPVVVDLLPKPDAQKRIPDNQGKQVLNVVAKVTSDTDLPPTAFDAEVNGIAVAKGTVVLAQDDVDKKQWVVEVNEAPLEVGENHVRLTAHNADGASETVEFFVNQVQFAAKPDILLGTPADSNVKVSTTDVTVDFQVVSNSPLARVDLVVASDETGTSREFPLGNQAPAGNRPNSFRYSQQLTLNRGLNRVMLKAQNDGGSTVKLVFINVVLPPLKIVLDKVESLDERGKVGEIAIGPDAVQQPNPGFIKLAPAAPTGHVTLHGHVEWTVTPKLRQDVSRSVDETDVIRVWVNGFLRMARLTPDPQRADIQRFQIDVVLNGKENRIELEHMALPVRVDNPRYALDCDDPELRQRLHLVMIGVSKVAAQGIDSKEIRTSAEKALKANLQPSGRPNTVSYGPLAGSDAVNENIKGLLWNVVHQINARARRQQLNDVVVVYYHGRETTGRKGEFLLADYRNWANPAIDRSAISSDYLSDQLNNRIPGAHLVLLDVNFAGKNVTQRWPRDPHLGMLRINTETNVHLLSEIQQALPAIASGNDIQLKALVDEVRSRGGRQGGVDSHVPVLLEPLIVQAID